MHDDDVEWSIVVRSTFDHALELRTLIVHRGCARLDIVSDDLPALPLAIGLRLQAHPRQAHRLNELASGRFAMIDDGLGFSLVPWRPVIEKRPAGRSSASCAAAMPHGSSVENLDSGFK